MKSPIDMNETEIRARFDFSRATRGRFAARYQNGHTVILLDHDPDEEKTILPADVVETTRQSGIRIFESQVREQVAQAGKLESGFRHWDDLSVEQSHG